MLKQKTHINFSRSLVLMVLIVLIGAVLRLYKLGEVPVSLYWDEAAMLVDVKSVVTTGADMHNRGWLQALYPSYGDYKLPVYIWLASALSLVLGTHEWTLRLPSALAGIATIMVAGGLANELSYRLSKDKTTTSLSRALVPAAMLVVALSPWSIMFSRTGFEGHVGQLWLGVSAWCLLRSRRHWGWLFMGAAFGALATYTYFSVRFVWPVMLAGFFLFLNYQVWWTPIRHKSWIAAAKAGLVWGAVPLLIFGLLLIPMVRSPFYADSNQFRLGTPSVLNDNEVVIESNVYREQAGNTPLDRIVFHRGLLRLRNLAQNYADNLSPNFLFVTGDANLRHGTTQHGLFFLVFMPFFAVGLYTLYDTQKRVLAFLLFWWLAALLPASVPEATPHALRSLNALLPVSLIIAWGVSNAYVWWQHIYRQTWRVALALSLVSVVALSLWQFTYYYFVIYPAASAYEWQQGYRETAQAIIALKGVYPAYIDIDDDRFYLWLMTYGPYDGHDFVEWSSQKFQFKEFDRIYSVPFTGWDDVVNDESRVVIAAKPAAVEYFKKTYPMHILEEVNIPDASGAVKLQVLLIKNPDTP